MFYVYLNVYFIFYSIMWISKMLANFAAFEVIQTFN